MKKTRFFLGALAGFLVTAVLLMLVNRVLLLKRYDGILTMDCYYAQQGRVDVLVLGSSHAGMHLDMATLWQEQGLAGYCLWGAGQPFWNSYHNLVEALKTGTPKVVVLEVLAATLADEYAYEPMQVRNTAGMRPSLNKWQAVKASAPPERWLDVWLELPLFHTRYDELGEADFQYFPWSKQRVNTKGGSLIFGKVEFPLPDVSGITECAPLPAKEQLYLENIVTLCREKQIPLVLLKTPSTTAEAEQPIYNTLHRLAGEWGVPFLNANECNDEIGILPQEHVEDSHLSGEGARKVAHWLGAWLKENYDLPDRRGEPDYASWDVFARTIELSYLRDIRDAELYRQELTRKGHRAEFYEIGQSAPLPAVLSPLSDLPLQPLEEEGEPGYYLRVYDSASGELLDSLQFLQTDDYALTR